MFEKIFLVQDLKVSQKLLLRRMFIVKVVFSSFVQRFIETNLLCFKIVYPYLCLNVVVTESQVV